MRDALRRFTLERALQLAIAAVIVTAVLAAGAIVSWLDVARKLRWLALAALVLLSLAYAVRRRARPRPGGVYAVAAFLVALAFVSASWSSDPRLTIARAASVAMLFLAAGALGSATAGQLEPMRRVLGGVLGGIAAVAAGGLLVLALRPDRAIAAATTSLPARYQGLGGGPDTATMVLAVGLPLAAWAVGEATRRPHRLAAAALFLLLLASIVASGSRGALVSGFGGLLAYAAVAERRRRGVVLTGLVALFAISLVVSRLPQPEARPSQVAPAGADTTPAAVAAAQTSGRYFDANLVLRQQDDIGHPPLGVAETRRRPRTLFGTSGRAEAWRGALEQGAERPLLGYGFGSEDDVFVDRYVHFHSDLPESSYIGLFLQLGGAGLFAFGALVAVVLARAARALRRLRGGELRIAAAAGGALVVGLILGFFQSYVYAAGNNATAAVWICAFLLTAATTVPAVRGRPVRA